MLLRALDSAEWGDSQMKETPWIYATRIARFVFLVLVGGRQLAQFALLLNEQSYWVQKSKLRRLYVCF